MGLIPRTFRASRCNRLRNANKKTSNLYEKVTEVVKSKNLNFKKSLRTLTHEKPEVSWPFCSLITLDAVADLRIKAHPIPTKLPLRPPHLTTRYWSNQSKMTQKGAWICYSVALVNNIEVCTFLYCRSQWPRGLRRRSAAARLLRLWARIPPRAGTFVCCECCVLSGKGLCDGLITRPEESYRMCCIVVCDLETSWMMRSWTTWGGGHSKNKKHTYLLILNVL